MILIVKFLIAIIGLIYTSQVLVNSASKLTKSFGISLFAVGAVFIAFSTTIPELFIGVNAALQGVSNISLGTVVGANIVKLSFVLGLLLVVFRQINLSDYVSKSSFYWVVVATFLPIILLYDLELSRLDGLILLLFFLAYIYSIFISKQKIREEYQRADKKEFYRNILIFVLAVIGLLFFAKLAVDYGRALATDISISFLILGLVFYAVSVSLPELVFSLRALKEKKYSLAFGDLIGALVANLTLVLGLTALINPIVLEARIEFFLAASFLALLTIFYYLIIKYQVNLTRAVGLILIALYFAFLVLEIV